MKWFLALLSVVCFVAATAFGILAMQGESLHAVSCIVMIIAGFCFAGISRVGE